MSESDSENGPEYAEYMHIAATNRRVRGDLLARANVVGVGVGIKQTAEEDTGVPCIVVMVSTKMPPEELAADDVVPEVVDDIPTDVVETGAFTASQFNARLRPAPGGISISPRKPGSRPGTLATTCLDARDIEVKRERIPNSYYILSCAHVLAWDNPQVGDAIIQPALMDGGVYPGDAIAYLDAWTTIDLMPPFGGGSWNFADAAIARMGTVERTSRLVHWIGYPRRQPPSGGLHIPLPKMRVQKTGRTTEFTTGRITNIANWLSVNMPGLPGVPAPMAAFGDVIVTSKIGKDGDSGSLVMEIDHNIAIGLLIGSSAFANVITPLHYVENKLGIRIAVDPA